ncbi:MAG: polyhydroxyalkanoate synthesis repressor PhaR [Dongiaceae bacterium]
MADTGTGQTGPITIKKYANRRLYNTATSSYVTLDHLCQMVKDGVEFTVFDAKTGEDITRQVLTQIIVEEESKGGQNLLPLNFLRQLIKFYGDNLQFLVPRYLEHSMESFARNQEQMRKAMQDSFGGMFPFGRFEEMGKQNLALFEQAMQMFNPFRAAGAPGATGAPEREAMPDIAGQAKKAADSVEALRQQLEQLQEKIDALGHDRTGKSQQG